MTDMYSRIAAKTGLLRDEVKRITYKYMYSALHLHTLSDIERLVGEECIAIVNEQQQYVSKMAELQELIEKESLDD